LGQSQNFSSAALHAGNLILLPTENMDESKK
jgi:hypothetical protein